MNVSVRGCGNARSCSAAGSHFTGSAFLLPVCPLTSLPSSHPSPHPLVPPVLILISGARAAAVSTLLQSRPVPPFVLRPISVWQGSSSNRFHPPDPSPLNTPPAATFFFLCCLKLILASKIHLCSFLQKAEWNNAPCSFCGSPGCYCEGNWSGRRDIFPVSKPPTGSFANRGANDLYNINCELFAV